MGISSGVGTAVEGVSASVAGCVAALDALDREDAALVSGDGAGVDASVDVLQRRYELRLERLELRARLQAQLMAGQAQDAAECIQLQEAMTRPDATAQERCWARMSVVEEVAGVLTVSSAAAGAFVDQAQRVCTLPPVMDALASGAMSWQHAKIVADETEGLDPAGAAGLVAHFFDPDAPNPARGAAPGELVPSRFRAKVRGWRERHHPESMETRHAKGVADRRMEYTPDRDGMAWVSLRLPGDTACAIWNRTTAIARGLQGPNEPRTITQLRPDIAGSLLLGGGTISSGDSGSGDYSSQHPGTHPGTTDLGQVPAPRPDVLVTVPVFALLGLTDEPAELDGYGPIPASMAHTLIADGASSFYRVLVDPRDGAPLEIGRKSYRLTEAIKRWIRMRDAKCSFPGCSNRTLDNETDHLTAWQHGGTTGAANLGQLCPKHHRLKHHSGWTPNPATINEPPGWTSPTGRTYKPEQQDPRPTLWPPGSLPLGVEPPCFDLGPFIGVTPRVDAMQQPGYPLPPLDLRLSPEEQQLLAAVPACPDPPPEEPPGEDLLDPDELSASDPLWDEFYAMPFFLPPDPQADWQLLLT